MNDISFYLGKYSNIGLKERQIKDSLLTAIEEICGFTVDNEKVKINNININLDLQGPEKSEIFIKTKQVQERFTDKLQEYGHNIGERKIF